MEGSRVEARDGSIVKKMMKKKTLHAIYGLLAIALAAPGARTAVIYTLDQDACTGTCGTAPFGTVSLEQTTADLVTVTETLAPNEVFAGTGAGDSLEFNVAGPVTIDVMTAGFGIGPSPDTASAFGSFLESVACTVCQGGKLSNPAGPLVFTVTSTDGVTVADFIGSSKGYVFASDIRGNNGNTGNVGALASTVPEPASIWLMFAGAALVGLNALRRRRAA